MSRDLPVFSFVVPRTPRDRLSEDLRRSFSGNSRRFSAGPLASKQPEANLRRIVTNEEKPVLRRYSISEAVTPVLSTPASTPAAKAKHTTPSKKRESFGAADPLQIIAVGSGGVEELAENIDSDTVSWALVRFQIGGGTFARSKCVAVHCNGELTPIMLRGWLNARSSEVLANFPEVSAQIEVTRPQELTVEFLCERLLHLFSSDDICYSLKELRAEYGKTVAEVQAAAKEAATLREQQARKAAHDAAAAEVERRRQELEELRRIEKTREADLPSDVAPTRDEALRGVGLEGSYSWALLEPDKLSLYGAGFGGVEEMKASLAEDRVLFGILRFSFGCADGCDYRFPDVTKHVFVQWVGPRTPVVRRGRWCTRLNDALRAVAPFAAVAFKREAHALTDLNLEDLVMEIRRLTIVDRRVGGRSAVRISVDEYKSVLAAEERARKTIAQTRLEEAQRREVAERMLSAPPAMAEPEPESPALLPEEPGLPDLRTAVQLVGKRSGEINWMLCGWPRSSERLLPTPAKGEAHPLAGVASPSKSSRKRIAVAAGRPGTPSASAMPRFNLHALAA